MDATEFVSAVKHALKEGRRDFIDINTPNTEKDKKLEKSEEKNVTKF